MDIQWLLQLPQQMTESGKIVSAPLALRAGDLLTASVLDVEKGRDALLAFGRFRAYARLPMPIVSGQAVQIRVEEKGDRLRMVMVPKRVPLAKGLDSDRLEIRLFEPVSDKPFLPIHSRSLVPGTTLQGRITGFEKDGLLLVDFGKFKAFAKIDIPVRQGQTIPLNVVKNENGINFCRIIKGAVVWCHPGATVHGIHGRTFTGPGRGRCGSNGRGSTIARSGPGGNAFTPCGRCGSNRRRCVTSAHGC